MTHKFEDIFGMAASFTVPETDGPTEVKPLASFNNAAPQKKLVPIAKQAKVIEIPPLLTKILSQRRCHGSQGDAKFRMWLHSELKAYGVTSTILTGGSVLVRTDPKSDTLFSCHIDTRHGHSESDTGKPVDLAFDPAFNHLFLANQEDASCLGADDGAGVYLLLELIKAKVPGSYLFHTGEECGGIGARDVVSKHEALLDEFSRAIAFDRRGTCDVVATQGGRACASVAFAGKLAEELNKKGLAYAVSHAGSFTDVKVYAGIIPECVNVSVGYENEHTSRELLDVEHLLDLVEACKTIKWDELPTVRKAEPDYAPLKLDLPKAAKPSKPTQQPAPKHKPKKAAPVLDMSIREELDGMSTDDIYDMVVNNEPEDTFKVIVELMLELEAVTAKYERARKLLNIT